MSTTPDQPRSGSEPETPASGDRPTGDRPTGEARGPAEAGPDIHQPIDDAPARGDVPTHPYPTSDSQSAGRPQPDAYPQPDPYRYPDAYSQPGAYPQPDAYQQPGPYQQGQYPAQYQQGQYPQGQYPQGQPYGAPGYGYGSGYPEQKSRLVAGLLGILIGSLGIHRFYLGYVGIGIAQIIVTIVTFGLGAVWGFIEGIMILVGAESFRRDAKGVPLKD